MRDKKYIKLLQPTGELLLSFQNADYMKYGNFHTFQSSNYKDEDSRGLMRFDDLKEGTVMFLNEDKFILKNNNFIREY